MSGGETFRARDALDAALTPDSIEETLSPNAAQAARAVRNHTPVLGLDNRLWYGEEVHVEYVLLMTATLADRYAEALQRIETLENAAREHQRDLDAVRRVLGVST